MSSSKATIFSLPHGTMAGSNMLRGERRKQLGGGLSKEEELLDTDHRVVIAGVEVEEGIGEINGNGKK